MPDDAAPPGGPIHVRGYTRWRNGQEETVSAYDRQGQPGGPQAPTPACSLALARGNDKSFQEICPLGRGTTP